MVFPSPTAGALGCSQSGAVLGGPAHRCGTRALSDSCDAGVLAAFLLGCEGPQSCLPTNAWHCQSFVLWTVGWCPFISTCCHLAPF